MLSCKNQWIWILHFNFMVYANEKNVLLTFKHRQILITCCLQLKYFCAYMLCVSVYYHLERWFRKSANMMAPIVAPAKECVRLREC